MKRALVTGGSGAIGRAIGQRLARDGLHVIVHTYQHPELALEVADAIRSAGGSAETTAFDVADEEQTRQVLTELLEAGPIQVLVNNAGLHDDAPMAGMSFMQWRRVIDVCLNGFFNVTQPLLLPMISTRWGRIVNISSLAGITGNRGQTNYAAAKAGLHGATKALALELASRGITVNAIAPGIIAGPATDAVFDAATIKTLVPMRRAGAPAEVADLVGFLTSEQAAYLTGQIISLNGGII
ncbi:MAG TPA: 3-oxoacyl-ACP reductase FabG [Candidatus Contendobacter sp.]|nr:3-oxoacyl-ACP reductase FabG [Candidatus Contendobacter sp.]HRZ51999.1 3-oxoacyl-ACP reductase FabG [Candidatus Contendobacter sp.]